MERTRYCHATIENAYEENTLELSCQRGRVISEIKFASFGEPTGTCGSFEKGSCEAAKSLSIIEDACISNERCSIDVFEVTFGPSSCNGLIRRLAIEAIC
ncbi:hypothetical protein L1049_009351 [Liquidambar formosana]|uniref:SUEL-type lectin domain-containing protein n=1 Tax=Liquidambar formosana TaxID=63359 RepID=A0AAP0S7P8_LIQFO